MAIAGKNPKVPPVVRGSVVVHRRRCGKPNCRCADGASLHEATVLSYSEAGRTRLVMLPADRVAAVRAATARYQRPRPASRTRPTPAWRSSWRTWRHAQPADPDGRFG